MLIPPSYMLLTIVECIFLSKLLAQVVPVLSKGLPINNVFFLDTSGIVLRYIKYKRKNWKPWVESCIIQTRKLLERDK